VTRYALLLALAAFLLLAFLSPVAAGELELQARDAITVVGRRVELSAKLTKRLGPLRPDQKGRTLEFQLGEAKASGRTDSDGVGRASLAPLTTGIVPFTVKVSDAPATQIKGRLWVLEPERPVVICDIDGTLSDMGGLRVPVSGWRAKAFPGAPELLRDLAKTHAIVYLTARDQSFRAASQGFLRKHDFPLGPLLLNSWGLDKGSQREQLLPSRHGRFKLKVLQRLQARGLKLALGIGDKPGDAEAYEGAGVRSFIRSKTALGERSIVFPDYATLRRRLAAEGLLPN
jgi:LNS2-like protein (lipin/Ned1/Smp2)